MTETEPILSYDHYITNCSTSVKTNRLKCFVNTELVAESFTVMEVNTSAKQKYFSRCHLADKLTVEAGVKSVAFGKGFKMYVLSAKQPNIGLYKARIVKALNDDTVTVRECDIAQMERHTLLQLLLNKIALDASSGCVTCNLTGHLYCFSEEVLQKEKAPRQITAVEVKIDSDMCVQLPVKTFTQAKYPAKYNDKQMAERPVYKVQGNTMVTSERGGKRDADNQYVLWQFPGKKNFVKFLAIDSLESFQQSKMGVLAAVVQYANNCYKQFLHIDFDTLKLTDSISLMKPVSKSLLELRKSCHRITNGKNLNVIDRTNTLTTDFVRELNINYGMIASLGTDIKDDCYNLVIEHEASFYDADTDPYKKDTKHGAIQHISIETLNNPDAKDSALETVMKELILKNDIMEGRISLCDWKDINASDYQFAICERDNKNNIDKIFIAHIDENGSMKFTTIDYPLPSGNPDEERIVSAFESNNAEDIAGVVMNKDGEINIICNDTLFSVPEIFEIENMLLSLDAKDRHLRSETNRDNLFSSVLEIKYMEQDGVGRYLCGIVGKGMNRTIKTSAHIRKVITCDGAKLFFNKLLFLMAVPFIRSDGQPTVIPFPFKYLREYSAMNGGNVE